MNADYRISPWATFPDQLIDVKRAIEWIREHADEIGADPNFIAISGGSAGGHLSALAALTPNDRRYQPGFEDADTSLQASIPFYGLYDLRNRSGHHSRQYMTMLARWVMKATIDDDPALYEAGSPLDQVNPDAPPFFIVHGSQDTLAPVQDAREFADALRAVSRSAVGYVELPGTQHAFDVFPSLRTAYVLDGIAAFLEHAYARSRARSLKDA